MSELRVKYLSNLPRIFLKLWENDEETILRTVTEPFFLKIFFPGAPGVKTGDFLGQIVDEPS